MAKSMRSKFKRKVRAISRVKKEPKERKLLEATVAKREAYEAAEAEAAAQKLPEVSQTGEESMDTDKKATINLKTMKLKDGSYPKWMNPGQIKKLKRKEAKSKKEKAKKTRGRR